MQQKSLRYIILLLAVVVSVCLFNGALYTREMFAYGDPVYPTDFKVRVVGNKKDSNVPDILVEWEEGWDGVEVWCTEQNAKAHDAYNVGYSYKRYDKQGVFKKVYPGDYTITLKINKNASDKKAAKDWHIVAKNINVPGPKTLADIRIKPICKPGGKCDAELSWDAPSFGAEISYANNTYKVNNMTTSYVVPDVDLRWPQNFYLAVKRTPTQARDMWMETQRTNVDGKAVVQSMARR